VARRSHQVKKKKKDLGEKKGLLVRYLRPDGDSMEERKNYGKNGQKELKSALGGGGRKTK